MNASSQWRKWLRPRKVYLMAAFFKLHTKCDGRQDVAMTSECCEKNTSVIMTYDISV